MENMTRGGGGKQRATVKKRSKRRDTSERNWKLKTWAKYMYLLQKRQKTKSKKCTGTEDKCYYYGSGKQHFFGGRGYGS
jgi:hypothetical protein